MSSLIDHLDFGNIYFKDKTYTPEVILANIDLVAENLTKRFISNSPFVYLFAPNHIKTVYGLFGILKAGRICVLVDPGLKRFELEEMIKDAAPGAIIRPDKETDTFDFFKEIEVKHYQLSPSRIDGLDDVAIMLYTAADDGFAKGAMLTHENILANARAIVESNDVAQSTVSCAFMPFHHLFALQTGMIAPSIIGGNVLVEDFSDFSAIRKSGGQLLLCKATHLYGVPTSYYFLSKLPEIKQILEYIASLVSGGAKLPRSMYESYKDKFGIEIHEGYGITEASPICSWHRLKDKVNIDSVGRAFPCCEIAIFNESNGQHLSPNQIGEICVKGSNVFKGYYNNPFATKEYLIDGWLHTGDLGYIDSDGYLFLAGLKKRMLNVSGNKVFLSELERFMQKHSNVLKVEAYGERDEILGDRVNARVQLRNNTPEAQKQYKEWCLANITRYKVPKEMNFVS